jgi:hypothetical protein
MYMKKIILLIISLNGFAAVAIAQTPQDSLTIADTLRQDSISVAVIPQTEVVPQLEVAVKISEQDIAIAPIIPENLDIPEAIKTILQQKMLQLLSYNNVAASSARFIMYPTVVTGNIGIAKTTPPKYTLKIEVGFYVEDAETDRVVGQYTLSLKGVGSTYDQAYVNAVSQINTRSASLKKMITTAKKNIVKIQTDKNNF